MAYLDANSGTINAGRVIYWIAKKALYSALSIYMPALLTGGIDS